MLLPASAVAATEIRVCGGQDERAASSKRGFAQARRRYARPPLPETTVFSLWNSNLREQFVPGKAWILPVGVLAFGFFCNATSSSTVPRCVWFRGLRGCAGRGGGGDEDEDQEDYKLKQYCVCCTQCVQCALVRVLRVLLRPSHNYGPDLPHQHTRTHTNTHTPTHTHTHKPRYHILHATCGADLGHAAAGAQRKSNGGGRAQKANRNPSRP
eukprot:836553-Rhodomonas_salina.1